MLGDKVVFKAPGKVLMTGGYGVLEEGNVGLTLAVDKYFYSVSSSVLSQSTDPIIKVFVHSPQINSKWNYVFNVENDSIEETSNIKNVFLQNALKFSLMYATKHAKVSVKSLSITILQDRGFLSEPEIAGNTKFINYTKESTKTGLGSSAGAIVVTVGAVIRQFLGEAHKNIINALSQIANLAAQNKIGSNFDISTAVYGSHLYKNILPKMAYETTSTLDFQKLLSIDPQINSLQLTSETLKESYSCMIDLKQGSNTRKMVSGFIKSLNEQTPSIITDFYKKSQLYVEKIYQLLLSKDSQELVRGKIKKINLEYRQFLQFYSSLTKIPVEPPEFKHFLDDVCLLDNVIYAICPGSGGYDAIFILSTAKTQAELSQLRLQLNQTCMKHHLSANISEIKILWTEPSILSQELQQIEKYLS